MFVVVLPLGVSRVTMDRMQTGPVVERVNATHIMKVADGYADDLLLRGGPALRDHCPMGIAPGN